MAKINIKSRKSLFLIGLALAGIAFTQLSLCVLGDEYHGSTVLVIRRGDLENLNFIDSSKAACKRMGTSRSDGALGFSSAFFCESRFAITIANEELALIRFMYSPSIARVAEFKPINLFN